MSTVTADERAAFVARAQAAAVRRVTRTAAAVSLVVGSWFWGIFALVTVAVPLIVHAAGGVMGGGVTTGAEYSSRWFAFSMGVVVTATVVVTHLAAGGTRRALWVGQLRAALVVGVAYGLAFVAVLLLERVVFGGLGWTWELAGAGLAPDGAGWIGVTFASEALVAATYLLGGVAVAAGYQTHGLWRGTFLVLPALVLLFLADVASRTGAGGDVLEAVLGVLGGPSPALGLLAGAAVLALAVAAAYQQVRTLRLRPTR